MPQERLSAQQTANSSLLIASYRRHRMMGAGVNQQQYEQYESSSFWLALEKEKFYAGSTSSARYRGGLGQAFSF